jgi:hypothetical protein
MEKAVIIAVMNINHTILKFFCLCFSWLWIAYFVPLFYFPRGVRDKMRKFMKIGLSVSLGALLGTAAFAYKDGDWQFWS